MEKKRILIVDDDSGIISKTIEYLGKINFSFLLSFDKETNAEKSTDILREKPDYYAVVLMDVEFKRQKMQGLEAVERIRSFSNIPIIMISASKEACRAGVDLGADSFMSKGIMSDDEMERCKAELEKVLDSNYKKMKIRPISNNDLVVTIKQMFLPLDIDMQGVTFLEEKDEFEKIEDYMNNLYKDNIDYMQKFIDLYYLVYKHDLYIGSTRLEASKGVKKKMVGRDSVYNFLENTEDEDSQDCIEMLVCEDDVGSFFRKLKDKKGAEEILSHEWIKKEGIRSYHDWYCRLCKILDYLA